MIHNVVSGVRVPSVPFTLEVSLMTSARSCVLLGSVFLPVSVFVPSSFELPKLHRMTELLTSSLMPSLPSFLNSFACAHIARLDNPLPAPLHREQVVVGQSSRRCHVERINTTQSLRLSIRLRLRLLLLQPRPARQRLRERLGEARRRNDYRPPELAPQPPDARSRMLAACAHSLLWPEVDRPPRASFPCAPLVRAWTRLPLVRSVESQRRSLLLYLRLDLLAERFPLNFLIAHALSSTSTSTRNAFTCFPHQSRLISSRVSVANRFPLSGRCPLR